MWVLFSLLADTSVDDIAPMHDLDALIVQLDSLVPGLSAVRLARARVRVRHTSRWAASRCCTNATSTWWKCCDTAPGPWWWRWWAHCTSPAFASAGATRASILRLFLACADAQRVSRSDDLLRTAVAAAAHSVSAAVRDNDEVCCTARSTTADVRRNQFALLVRAARRAASAGGRTRCHARCVADCRQPFRSVARAAEATTTAQINKANDRFFFFWVHYCVRLLREPIWCAQSATVCMSKRGAQSARLRRRS